MQLLKVPACFSKRPHVEAGLERSRSEVLVAFMIALLLSMYFVHVAYAVIESRFLFADGVLFFVKVLDELQPFSGGRPTQRLFANILTTMPLLLSVKAGIFDLDFLRIIYGASSSYHIWLA